MRSLAFKETALGPRSGSLASNGEASARACSLRMWVSRRIEKFFGAKRAAAIRTRVADTGVREGVECGAIGKVSFHRGQVMDPADLRRYHRLLLKKQRELSSALGEGQSRVPAAGGLEGDLIDQANADEEAELQIHLHQTEGRLARAIEE